MIHLLRLRSSRNTVSLLGCRWRFTGEATGEAAGSVFLSRSLAFFLDFVVDVVDVDGVVWSDVHDGV